MVRNHLGWRSWCVAALVFAVGVLSGPSPLLAASTSKVAFSRLLASTRSSLITYVQSTTAKATPAAKTTAAKTTTAVKTTTTAAKTASTAKTTSTAKTNLSKSTTKVVQSLRALTSSAQTTSKNKVVTTAASLVVTTAGETLGSMYISGYLYLDTNNDGVRTAKDASISGARICVIPAGYENNSTYWFSALTDKNGYYKIPLYSPGTYSVAQLYQPQNFIDGKDTPGLVIGADGNPVYAEYGEAIASPDTLDLISGIVLPQGGHAINYNFGELSATGTLLSKRYLLSSTPSSSSGATSYPTHAYNLPDGGNVPEPGTLVLLAAGGVGLVGMAWKRRRQRRQSSSAAAV